MKNFNRDDLLFSLCGLNCALCIMKIDGHCPGCGGGAGNQGCSISRCSIAHSGYQYCFQCDCYPCAKYDGITEFDSFITHRNQLSDMERAKALGLSAYHSVLGEKASILKFLLGNYNDGRRKSFFCLAINLLEIQDIYAVVEQIKKAVSEEMPLKERAEIAVKYFNDAAEQKGIVLKPNKKPLKPRQN